MTHITRSIASAACGAVAMYWLDPDRGRRRRAALRDRLISMATHLNHSVALGTHDLGYRARGSWARLRSIFLREEVADVVIAERVRAMLGRAVSHPSAIDVGVSKGCVKLRGSVLAQEYTQLLYAVHSVRGVTNVTDELGVYESAAGIPQLQGGHLPQRTQFAPFRDRWPPAVRLIAGGMGTTIGVWGLRQAFASEGNALLGSWAIALGTGLLLRSTINRPVHQLTGISGRHLIDIRKSIFVAAPVEHVFDVLRNFTHFPTFMRNVRKVTLHTDGRSHWVVAGPAGTSIEWNAQVTAFKLNELLGWRTVNNAPVTHTGTIRFERAGAGTRLHVQMTYNPLGGVLGHGVAKLFRTDPKRELDEDLNRLKLFIEAHPKPSVTAHLQPKPVASAV